MCTIWKQKNQHLNLCDGTCRIKWMNPRACTNEAYTPTSIEHMANVATHGIWVVPSVIGGIELVRRSATWAQFVSACVYGTSLILVFAVSTFFHSVHYCNHNRYTHTHTLLENYRSYHLCHWFLINFLPFFSGFTDCARYAFCVSRKRHVVSETIHRALIF